MGQLHFHFQSNFREQVAYRSTFSSFCKFYIIGFLQVHDSIFVEFQTGGRVQNAYFVFSCILDRRSSIDALFHFLSNFRQAVAFKCIFSFSFEFQIGGRVQMHFFIFYRVLRQGVAYRCNFSFFVESQISGRVNMHRLIFFRI